MRESSFYSESLPGKLAQFALEQEKAPGFTFIKESGETETLTFGELAARVRSVSFELKARLTQGDRVVLLYSPGLEFICAFLGCLVAGVVAVPAFPPKKNRKSQRLHSIINDCLPAALLTTSSFIDNLSTDYSSIPSFATDKWPTGDAPDWDQGLIKPETVAFLQYTSGSTGDPKGVMVTHGNIAKNEQQIQKIFGHDKNSIVVGWLPLFHDMGLIGNVMQPLYVGFHSVFFSPSVFTQDPIRWLKAISTYRGTTSGGPNFAFDYCSQNITDEEKAGIDLSCIEVLYNGSEPVRLETIDLFSKTFSSCGFRRSAFLPCYGLAEATLLVSGKENKKEPNAIWVEEKNLSNGKLQKVNSQNPGAKCLVSTGRPAEDTEVVIWDTNSHAIADKNTIGEIWVKGDQICMGYWNRPELTQKSFKNQLPGNSQASFFATGDLGVLYDGELYVTGRLKDLIIIRGRNIYPQDIEALVENVLPYPSNNGCAAIKIEDNGENLGLVIEADRTLTRLAREKTKETSAVFAELYSAIKQRIVEEFDVAPIHISFVRPASFPRTSSGKVQRSACRSGLKDGSLEIIHSWDYRTDHDLYQENQQSIGSLPPPQERDKPRAIIDDFQKALTLEDQKRIIEELIHRRLSRLLGFPPELFESGKPFDSFGIDSVSALEISKGLEMETGLHLPVTLIWSFPTIRKLAEELVNRMQITTEKKDYNQKELTDSPTDQNDMGELESLIDILEGMPDQECKMILDGNENPKPRRSAK